MLDTETVYSYIGELEGEFEKKRERMKETTRKRKKKRDERTFLRLCVLCFPLARAELKK